MDQNIIIFDGYSRIMPFPIEFRIDSILISRMYDSNFPLFKNVANIPFVFIKNFVFFIIENKGDILFIESILSKGKGALNITGNLGKVMKESATIAMEFIKANAETFGINASVFDKYNVHIHVPEGATPKDGPSAGVTMLTSLVSLFTQRKVKKSIAMTGEITLRGKVLPVGGIKEKILAAKRAKIKEILLCKENEKDILEINQNYLKGLKFHYVSDMSEVINIALTSQKVKDSKVL